MEVNGYQQLSGYQYSSKYEEIHTGFETTWRLINDGRIIGVNYRFWIKASAKCINVNVNNDKMHSNMQYA